MVRRACLPGILAAALAAVCQPALAQAAPTSPAPRLGRPSFLTPVAGEAPPARAEPTQVLSFAGVLHEVLARNPSLAQMAAAAQAAAMKVPQATSPDDPMFTSMLAPVSLGSNSVQPGYRIEVSQKLLWPEKRHLRGEAARAEAGAAGEDLAEARLQLIETASGAYADYFLVHRALEVNDEAGRLLAEFRANAESRFRTGQITQQDLLQAEAELNKQRERALTLERMRRVAAARLNTLMHRDPGETLPGAPTALEPAAALPPVQQLMALALAARPELRALEARLAADRAALALAAKDYWGDLELAAGYDTIMGNGPMRDLAPQVGLRMNLPVRTQKRDAAVDEARARIAQRCAELAARVDQVKLQVQEAYEQAVESERLVQLYQTRVLPQSAEYVKAAQSAYVTGKAPFVSLIEAQRSLVMQRDRSFEVAADAFRRRATLDRVVGIVK